MARAPIDYTSPLSRVMVFQSCSYTPGYYRKVRDNEILEPLPYSMAEISSDAATVWKFTTWRGSFDSTIIPRQLRCIQDGDYQIRAKQECDLFINDEIIKGRRNKLLSKIKGQTLPLLMLYKERHQTGAMLTKLIDDMIYFTRNYKRPQRLLQHYGFLSTAPKGYQKARKWYKANKASHTVGDYYLQWRFGWRPFYKDLEDSLNARANAEKKGKMTSMRSGLPWEVTRDVVNALSAEDSSIDGSCTASGYFGIKCHYRVSDVTLAAAAQIMSVEETAWDAMPWSFMIDRLVNVSQYLNLRNATAGVEFIKGYETNFLKYTICGITNVKTSRAVAGSPIYVWTYWDGPPRVETHLTRTIITGFPQPTLTYPYKEFLDQKYWGDILALVHQKFSKKVF